VLGQYGRERWDGATGRFTVPGPDPAVTAAAHELPDVLARANVGPGVRVEDKGGAAVAVHTRGAADPEGVLRQLDTPLADLARRHGLLLDHGRLVLELRPPGVDKGAALRALVTEYEPTAVLFAGDDLGDLPAYDAIDQLRAAGVPGLKVCSSSAEVTGVAERADLVVDGPAGVVALLAALADGMGGGHTGSRGSTG
jgi:trehalose 6-phosphate phosphatase